MPCSKTLKLLPANRTCCLQTNFPNKIFKIIEFIPELNQLVNSIYNKLSMNITEEESKQKIRSILYTELGKEIESYKMIS